MRNKGITLIALVITIIVLLILAGITINLTLGEHGILNMAKEAGKNYQNAAEYEQGALQDFYNEAQNIINSGNNKPTISEKTVELKTKAQPGDYVEYDGKNGYSGLWRVLYNDETYGLQIISSESVGNLTLGSANVEEAKKSYNEGIGQLTAYCEKYVNEKFATNGRCLGSDPLGVKDATTEYYMLLAYYNGSKETGLLVGSDSYRLDGGALQVFEKNNPCYSNNGGFWMACRTVEEQAGMEGSSLGYAWYSDIARGAASSCYMIRFWPTGSSMRPDGEVISYKQTRGVRPVITLFNNIKTNDGDGSETNPFRLVEQ